MKSLRLRILRVFHLFPVVFAHKPLCGRFRSHSVKIGRSFFCRSCLAFYSGAISGALLLASVRLLMPVGFTVSLVLGSTLVSLPKIHDHLPRSVRDLTRFFLGFSIALPFYFFCIGQTGGGAFTLFVLVCGYVVMKLLRSKKYLKACSGCPELGRGQVCSGFSYQAELFRNFERDAIKILNEPNKGVCR